ncbi:hypothetical protein EXS71_03745 [Candidatus Uhrbacteria bacterium]|nr:hypothetical protein [Candidatus Uhrbacteria bacterium]
MTGDPKMPGPVNLEKGMEELRERIHREMRVELEGRLKKNPKPSEQELVMGAFQEELEPQVREALTIMYQKGYSTSSSGFYGGGMQAIDGEFILNADTVTQLKVFGVQVESVNNYYTFLKFQSTAADQEVIRQQAVRIAKALPDQEMPAFYSRSLAGEEFRAQYGDPLEVKRMQLERRLALGYLFDDTKEKLERNLEEVRAEIKKREETIVSFVRIST